MAFHANTRTTPTLELNFDSYEHAQSLGWAYKGQGTARSFTGETVPVAIFLHPTFGEKRCFINCDQPAPPTIH